ncbi:hypothetical protein PMAYCL1PPCAC_00297, partial [Pristionchus mayeri]
FFNRSTFSITVGILQRVDQKEEVMAEKCENSKVADLQERLANKETELENAINSFRTVLALKNKKIRELEEENRRLKEGKYTDINNALSEQMKDMQSKFVQMERTLIINNNNNTQHLSGKIDAVETKPSLQGNGV